MVFFTTMQHTQLYVRLRGGILPTCGKHLHDHIILLKCVFWAHKPSFNPPLFIEVPVSSQESQWLCYIRVFIFPVSIIFLLYFGQWQCGIFCLSFYEQNQERKITLVSFFVFVLVGRGDEGHTLVSPLSYPVKGDQLCFLLRLRTVVNI